jgi:hypothetical protein
MIDKKKTKVYWASRHALIPEQIYAIKEIHGKDIEIIQENVVFQTNSGLRDYIRLHPDGYVYALASGIHVLTAAFSGQEFFIFEGRANAYLDFCAIYKINDLTITRVWEDKTSYTYEE